MVVVLGLSLLAGFTGAWFVDSFDRGDRATAEALLVELTAVRSIADGRSLESRWDAAIERIALDRQATTASIRGKLERFASGGWFARKRTGYDAFLALLARRRFESAIASVRDLGAAARAGASSRYPAWQLVALTGNLEFSRGRAVVAEPILTDAFELANRLDQLDVPATAPLHVALGMIQLGRSKPADAEPYFRRAAAILRQAPQADLRDRARALSLYARSLAAQGFPEEADPLCREALAALASFHRTTGRVDADQSHLEDTWRAVLRERGLAEAEIDARVREAR